MLVKVIAKSGPRSKLASSKLDELALDGYSLLSMIGNNLGNRRR
jgi:hypothetical protein